MTRYFVGALAAAALALAGCNNRAGTGYSGNAEGNGTPSNGAMSNNPGATGASQGQSGGSNTATASGTYGQASEGNASLGQSGQLLQTSGTVKNAGGSSITLVTPNQGQLKLNTSGQTAFIGPTGEKISKDSVQQGDEVRAAYKFDGKNNLAYRIEVTRMPNGQSGSQNQQGQRSQGKSGSQNQQGQSGQGQSGSQNQQGQSGQGQSGSQNQQGQSGQGQSGSQNQQGTK